MRWLWEEVLVCGVTLGGVLLADAGVARIQHDAPPARVEVVNLTAWATEQQYHLVSAAIDTPITATPPPRVATPEACAAVATCGAEYGDSALPWYAQRVRPFTLPELSTAIELAGFDRERGLRLERMVTTCESSTRDAQGRWNAGWVNHEAGPSPEQWAYGAAQMQIGWFDQAGIPREQWASLTANMRAAKYASDKALSLGMAAFGYWSC